jgi:hypothetical protein
VFVFVFNFVSEMGLTNFAQASLKLRILLAPSPE